MPAETGKYRLSDRIDLPRKVNNRAFFKTSTLFQSGILRQLIVGEVSGAGSGAGKWLVAEQK